MTADDTYEEPQQTTDKKSKFDLNEPEEEQTEINEELEDENVEQEVLEEEEPVEEVKSEPTRKRKPRKE